MKQVDKNSGMINVYIARAVIASVYGDEVDID